MNFVKICITIGALINCFVLCILLPCFLVGLSLVIRLISILIRQPRLFVTVDDWIMQYGERLIIFCCQTLPSHEIVLHGNTKVLEFLASRKRKDHVIYLSNHTAASDWIVSEFLSLKADYLAGMKFVLKNSLRYSPISGWFLRQRNCIYVRRGAKELNSFKKQMHRIAPGGFFSSGSWLVIFPEGTRIKDRSSDPKVFEANDSYSMKQNMNLYSYLLTPKTRGLYMCTSEFLKSYESNRTSRDASNCWLLDATIMYEPVGNFSTWKWLHGRTDDIKPRPKPVSIIGLLTGGLSHIHIHLDLKSMTDVNSTFGYTRPPADEQTFTRWLEDLFLKKDKLLTSVVSRLNSTGAITFDPTSKGQVISRPWKETLPYALLGWLSLLVYFYVFGIKAFVFHFVAESIICYILLAIFKDDSDYV